MSTIAILHYTAPPEMGGVEAVIEAHAREFVNDGHSVTIIAGRGGPEPPAKVYEWGGRYLRIPEIDSLDPTIRRLSADLWKGNLPPEFEEVTNSLLRKLEPILRRFDHLFIHNLLTKEFNIPLTAALFRILEGGVANNWINWCHDLTWASSRRSTRERVRPGYPWDLLRTYKPELIYVTGSPQRRRELAEMLQELSGLSASEIIRHVNVVFNGVDPGKLLGLSRETLTLIQKMNLWDNDLIILMPVRISDAKNIGYALDLVAALHGTGSKASLVVTGPPDTHGNDMPLFRELKERRRILNLDSHVHFVFDLGPEPGEPNFIDYETVGELYRVSDLVFMPSLREGFGIPVFEAALARVPVICSDKVPAAEAIGGGLVLSFDPLEVEPGALADTIVKRMEQDALYAARLIVRRNYKWQDIYRNGIRPLLKIREKQG